MGKIVAGTLAVLVPALLFAQDRMIPEAGTRDAIVLFPSAGHFFAAIVAGVVLALAFQLILTNLSVAAGLNLLGNVTSPDAEPNKEKDDDDSDTSVAGTAQKINTAFGVWALVTASIALFAAGWLAGRLSMTASLTVGAVIGLTIWGLFYLTTMTIEVNAVTSLVGTLGRMAASGLRTAYGAVSSVFSKSEETKAADTAAKIVAAVKEELFDDVDLDDVKKQIQKYVSQLAPQKIDPADIRKEFQKLLDNTEIQAIAQHDGAYIDRDVISATLKSKGMSSGDIARLVDGVQDAFAKIKEEASSNKDVTSKVTDAAMRVAGLSPDEARQQRERIEEYLRNTGKEELNPDGIKRDIERLFTNRKESVESLKSRFASIDKDTVVAVLSQRKDLTREEAQHIVDQVQRVLQQVTSTTSSTAASLKESITGKLRNYLNGLQKPELEYEGLEHDFRQLFHDPKAGADALLNRLKAVDRDTIKKILSSREDVSEEDAERIIRRIESVRDSMIGKAQQMKIEVERRLAMAKDEALHQADQVRAVAATAAWWAFGTAVVSGVAAALGGMLATGAL